MPAHGARPLTLPSPPMGERESDVGLAAGGKVARFGELALNQLAEADGVLDLAEEQVERRGRFTRT